MKYTKPLSQSLQSIDCSLITATQSTADLVGLLQSKRIDNNHFAELLDRATLLANHLSVELKIPRVCSRQQHGSNITVALQTETDRPDAIATYYRLKLHNPFLDHRITEITVTCCCSHKPISGRSVVATVIGCIETGAVAKYK